MSQPTPKGAAAVYSTSRFVLGLRHECPLPIGMDVEKEGFGSEFNKSIIRYTFVTESAIITILITTSILLFGHRRASSACLHAGSRR
jgi:hypothetical protein